MAFSKNIEEVEVFSTKLKKSGKIIGGSISLKDVGSSVSMTHYILPLDIAKKLAKLHVGKNLDSVKGLMFKVSLKNGAKLNTSYDDLTLLNTDCKSIW